jgi:hypothetical protein
MAFSESAAAVLAVSAKWRGQTALSLFFGIKTLCGVGKLYDADLLWSIFFALEWSAD